MRTMTEQENTKRRNTMALVAMVLVFLLPFLLAWYMAYTAEHGRGTRSGAQHGVLIIPPRALQNLDVYDPVTGEKTMLYGKWTMLALLEGECGQDCKDVLYRMRQIRLAAGDNLFRVQRVVCFADEGVEKNAKDIFAGYEGQLILARDKADADFRKNFQVDGKTPAYAIYLVDPRGFLMMYYLQDADPTGIIKDLKRLLKTAG